MSSPSPLQTPHPWRRYVAIGDSFSEGLSDAHPAIPGRYVGWTDRLAAHLSQTSAEGAPFEYANLAIRGRLLADIVGPQLDAALQMKPDLVSMVGGGNDYLRPSVDIDALAASLGRAVATIRHTGADVLLITPNDPRDAPILRRVRGRAAIYTSLLHGIAARHGTYLVDLWNAPWLQDWRLWSDDRIHMTSEGHRRVALAALAALGLPTDPEFATPLPAQSPPAWRERVRADARWARQYGAPWISRRLNRTSSGAHVTPKHERPGPVN